MEQSNIASIFIEKRKPKTIEGRSASSGDLSASTALRLDRAIVLLHFQSKCQFLVPAPPTPAAPKEKRGAARQKLPSGPCHETRRVRTARSCVVAAS